MGKTPITKLVFFIGKGGVGKTTVSSAYAVCQARLAKRPVLLVSTDPAHSLGDVFQQRFSDHPARVRPFPLWVAEINAEERFGSFLNSRKEELLSILERGSLFSRDEIAPFLDITLPGMAEISALITIHDALSSAKYSQIVVDTAPFGHTLRLFELPRYFAGFLKFLELAATRDQLLAEHFGGAGGMRTPPIIQDWQQALALVEASLHTNGKLFLVTTPEKFALHESLRCAEALQRSSFRIAGVVLNRAVLRAGKCPICHKRSGATTEARRVLRRQFPDAQFHFAEDSGSPVLGVESLENFAEHVFANKRVSWASTAPKEAKVKFAPAVWPELRARLTLVVGKGGVGKTTISAALGFHSRVQTREPVDICSVDPAPSLDDIFQTDVGAQFRPVPGDARLRAAEMDSVAEFDGWAQEMKRTIARAMRPGSSRVHIDFSFERRLFEQLLDSVPPGVDELFSVFRIQEMLSRGSGKLVIDMAPTGHALELLRTPERLLAWTRLLLKTLAAERKLAFAQDAAVEVAALGRRTRGLVQFLKDRKRAGVCVVMLAEPLPDRETARLLHGLQSLNLPVGPIFVNRVLFSQNAGKCWRCRNASNWQMATLAKLRRQYPKATILVARNFPQEIVGMKGLQAFTRELWRIQ